MLGDPCTLAQRRSQSGKGLDACPNPSPQPETLASMPSTSHTTLDIARMYRMRTKFSNECRDKIWALVPFITTNPGNRNGCERTYPSVFVEPTDT